MTRLLSRTEVSEEILPGIYIQLLIVVEFFAISLGIVLFTEYLIRF